MAGVATILHADLDAFYASVEQLLDPSLRGKPIAVGGGVVLAASYEAKAFGVHGGMSGRQARQLCPQIRFVGGNFKEYVRLGDEVMEILRSYTPVIERISIDEAFLDVSGSVHLFGPPAQIGAAIRHRVRDEVGLSISVGVARTKHLAKIASQVAKPDGLVVVEPERETEFLHPLPVDLLWGVGPVTKHRLVGRGIVTIGDLAETPGGSLERLLGRAVGGKLGALAWNEDPRRVETHRRASSVSAQSALGRRVASDDVIRGTVRHLSDRVAPRLRAKQRAGRTITVRVRFEDLSAVTRSVTLPAAVAVTPIIAAVAEDLVQSALADHPNRRVITLVSVAVSNLVYEEALQLELPLDLGDQGLRPGTEEGAERWALDRAVDEVRERFGRNAVGYASVALSGDRSVPDAFRELAER
ncbi:MAG: DNA polymerase IV [Acidimicrobiia bacterium]